jgi:hypothetical protein
MASNKMYIILRASLQGYGRSTGGWKGFPDVQLPFVAFESQVMEHIKKDWISDIKLIKTQSTS